MPDRERVFWNGVDITDMLHVVEVHHEPDRRQPRASDLHGRAYFDPSTGEHFAGRVAPRPCDDRG